MEVAFLGSGSSGNCAVVRAGRTAVLLDAGLSPRDTARRLKGRGISLDEVSALLLTHEHSDHVRGALDLAEKRRLPIYATAGTARAAAFPGPLLADVRIVRGGDEIVYGGELHVRVTRTPHDGEESVCFVFSDGTGRRVGVATDLGHLSREVAEALRGCEVIGLEANHDVDLLRDGPYPSFLKRRILSDVGHLSNEDAAAGLRDLVTERTRHVVALHVSRHNNTFALAGRVFREALFGMGADVPHTVALPDVATEWIGA
ncbi:MAG: MBL fold metallo-hydrolase [Acidithiobacillales bacterium]